MPQQIEQNANNALGALLRRMLPRYNVLYENTQQIVNRPGLRPDVLITATGRSPVVVEAEYMPAYTAETEAKDRLGLEVAGTARHIDAAIALRYPEAIKDAYHIDAAVSDAKLSYCVHHSDGTRFPQSGWLEGSVEDLSDLIRLVSVPQRAVDEAADALEKGIDRAANILEQLAKSRPGVVASIAGLLGMSDVIQTYRMAGAIVANAMVFHERIAGMHGIKPLSQLCSPRARSPKEDILDSLDRDTQDQLLAHLRHRPRHRRAASLCRGVPNLEKLALHGYGGAIDRCGPGTRPHRPHLPATDSRPQVPGHLLHPARVRRPPRAARRRQALS